nr:Chain B, Histone-lysine N-methyltransferase MLL [Homo sapiens]
SARWRFPARPGT